MDEVKHLQCLPSLRVLWLCDNPCASSASYRDTVISMLPHLSKLDNDHVGASGSEIPAKEAADTSARVGSAAPAAGGIVQRCEQAPITVSPPRKQDESVTETQHSSERASEDPSSSPLVERVVQPAFKSPGASAMQEHRQPPTGQGNETRAPFDAQQYTRGAASKGPGACKLLQAVLLLVDELHCRGDEEALQAVQRRCRPGST